MDMRQIEELVEIVRNSKISELAVETEGSKVRVRKQLREMTPTPSPTQITVETVDTAPEPEASHEAVTEGVLVTAPMVGIFHKVDSLEEAGSPVRKGQVIGAIESMKLMNEIVSEYDGAIAEVMVEDGAAVEYGQELFKIEPSSKVPEDADASE